ncbi:MAG: carbamoyl phosphate synthase small subunit [Ignavibacteriae bacterium HGW-Ignavibacteriae-1]|jgi:carbamoyl-phosphate synthase small subunit|nr:MAG: carbamoyl phosphate synthase small subunit [Ignavibacteriae bacterium HGW-Ignavibacteriae-1]
MSKKALVMLESGFYLYGETFCGSGECFGEFVFNTAMTGYEEIVTDPSYRGQIVTFTYPLIGNYGVTFNNLQSNSIHSEAVIIRENSAIISNHAAKMSFADFLTSHGKMGIHKLDTRALTTRLRKYGAIKGGISTDELDPEKFLQKITEAPDISDFNLYEEVIGNEVLTFEGNTANALNLLVVDFGIKRSILENLRKYYNHIYLVPFDINFDANIANLDFDAVFLSNGPGDPRIVHSFDKYLHEFAYNNFPIIGICFGHQLIGKAFGLKIDKLIFGHHGGNHPVKNIETGKVFITSQNHNYAISHQSIIESVDWNMNWLHLYDNTVSGIKHKTLPISSVQFHPEASPGPNDAALVVFDDFFKIVKDSNA